MFVTALVFGDKLWDNPLKSYCHCQKRRSRNTETPRAQVPGSVLDAGADGRQVVRHVSRYVGPPEGLVGSLGFPGEFLGVIQLQKFGLSFGLWLKKPLDIKF